MEVMVVNYYDFTRICLLIDLPTYRISEQKVSKWSEIAAIYANKAKAWYEFHWGKLFWTLVWFFGIFKDIVNEGSTIDCASAICASRPILG